MAAAGLLENAAIFLSAAVIAVPISKRLGFGSVLGYLSAGILIGPHGFALIGNVEDILHFSELGVVMLLFLIGLELEPKKLWRLRAAVLGLGGLQLALTAMLVMFCSLLFLKWSWAVALVAGLGFALSSTAIALQILEERQARTTEAGRGAFAILLFQDLAVIPMIAVVPLLAASSGALSTSGANAATMDWSSVGRNLGLVAGVLVLVFFVFRLFLRHALRIVASLHLREVFTALALLLVIGMGVLMQQLELSMGLGAFIAGVLLADSEYRHAVETDIEPFKGLLLGLFFISVGMSIGLPEVLAAPWSMLGAVITIVLLKALILGYLALRFRVPKIEIPIFVITLSQVGEFAFVFFGAAKLSGIIDSATATQLIAITAVSMLSTPLILRAWDRWGNPYLLALNPKSPQDTIADENPEVIIAGFGRVGQIVGRLLFSQNLRATVLDYEADQVEMLRQFGFKVYYGDATRLDLLEAAGIRKAKVFVAAIDDVAANTKIVELVKREFPHIQIVSRVRNVAHLFDLWSMGVLEAERESFSSSLQLGQRVLHLLGWGKHEAREAAQRFQAHDLELLDELFRERSDQSKVVSRAKQARDDLTSLFQQDREKRAMAGAEWGTYAPPVGEPSAKN